MESISFSYNWNSKLDCDCFTTIRLKNDRKYVPGNRYRIFLKGEFRGIADLVDVKYFKLEKLNNWMAMLDTGYGLDQTKGIISKMYSRKVDLKEQEFCYLLLAYIKK